MGIVKSCSVYNNNAELPAKAGGIFNDGGTIQKCEVFENTCGGLSSTNAGGIYNNSGTIKECIVYKNLGRDSGISNNNGLVENCIIYANGGEIDYTTIIGGIGNYGGTVRNCTIFGNKVVGFGFGGIGNLGTGVGIIVNTISWGNSINDIYPSSSQTITHCCFNEANGDNGNLAQDPQFFNIQGGSTTWDFHLNYTSPCVDTGTDENAPEQDIDGISRPQSLGYDMGAYERMPMKD